jgi:hypothetical protein
MRHLRAALIAVALLATTPSAFADRLLIERVDQEATMNLPKRGMSMAEVERRFGAPAQRLEPRGGQKRQWPAIHRWTYPNFVVYFENTRVIDAVAIQAGSNEVGPKPPIK